MLASLYKQIKQILINILQSPGTVYTKFIHMSYLILTRFIHLPYQAHCQSTTRKALKTNPKIHQKYLPNPPKMGPESLPGMLLGASGEKGTFIWLFGSPEERQTKPRRSTQITKKHKLSKHDHQKMLLKSIPEKTSEICDFLSHWNPPDRALAAAGAPFSQFHRITEKCSKVTKRRPILMPWDHKKC